MLGLLRNAAKRRGHATTDVHRRDLREYSKALKNSIILLPVLIRIYRSWILKLNRKGNPEYLKTLNYLFSDRCHATFFVCWELHQVYDATIVLPHVKLVSSIN